MGGELLLHDHQIGGHVLRLQKLAELKVHAERVDDEVSVLCRQPHKRRHDLRLRSQNVLQGQVVPGDVKARSQFLPEFPNLAQGVDGHERECRVHGLLCQQLARLLHPFLDPCPTLLGQLLLLGLLSDEGLVLAAHEPHDGEHGTLGLHALCLRSRIEVGQFGERPHHARLELPLRDATTQELLRELLALLFELVEDGLVGDGNPHLRDASRFELPPFPVEIEGEILEGHRAAEVFGKGSQLLESNCDHRPRSAVELLGSRIVDLQQDLQRRHEAHLAVGQAIL
mmetsp:Transcript_31007/g.78425  ORF Transcript_31007/g.78425 Transcript_31007/m.78425 type:complete len:284 (+) Transcript_31007:1101-1952(+)